MKIWHESVSEHSMKLVMIGSFKEVQDADKAKEVIDRFTSYAIEKEHVLGEDIDRFDKSMLSLMESVKIYTLRPAELEQFMYDVHVEVEGSKVVINTDESEISAFMKILIDKGARVEVYSAHDHPDVSKDDGGE
jgi:hypothetical protein